VSSRSILHRPSKYVFDLLLHHVVPIDVGLLRLRIDVVADVHIGILSPSSVRSN
jgi:hypothetical protein